MIATGGRDNKVKIWDYELLKDIDERNEGQDITNAHQSEVSLVRFIKPFPLLITTDANSQLYVWVTKPHKDSGTCLINWRNTFSLTDKSQITALDTYYNETTGQFLMIIGDERGKVRIQDISGILKQTVTAPIKPIDTTGVKRNPYRVIDFKQQKQEEAIEMPDTDERIKNIDSVLNESEVIQIGRFEAHSESIKSIQYVSVTDQPLIFTAGIDKYVRIHNLDGEKMGELKQGYMLSTNYEWNFSLSNYDAQLPDRQAEVNALLTAELNLMEAEKRAAKVQENKL